MTIDRARLRSACRRLTCVMFLPLAAVVGGCATTATVEAPQSDETGGGDASMVVDISPAGPPVPPVSVERRLPLPAVPRPETPLPSPAVPVSPTREAGVPAPAAPERVIIAAAPREPRGETAGDDDPPPASSPPADSATPSAAAGLPSTPPAPDPTAGSAAERRVAVGELFEVRRPDATWLFVEGDRAAEFLDRRIENGIAVFTFRLAESADAALRFEAQDLSTGERAVHVERILPGEEAASQPEAVTIGPDEGAEGQDLEALATALSQGDARQAPEAPVLLQEVERLSQEERFQLAADLLAGMRVAGIAADDELLYRLGRLYESEWPGQDLVVARDLYMELVNSYPLSLHRQPAQRRIEYLNRHFFYIR